MRLNLKPLLHSLSCHAITKRFYTPRRALLYVPGSDKRKIEKIPSLKVDCAVLDCEDGVAVNKKEEARHNICDALNNCDMGKREICVRVNSVDSGIFEDDFQAVVKNEKLPTTMVLPKVESVDHINLFADALGQSLQPRNAKMKTIIMVESAKSLMDFKQICESGAKLSQSTPMQLEAVIFGSDDYCADIGATRTSGAMELLYARQKIVTIAKMFRIQAIDLVHIDYKDLDGLKTASEESSRMGFTGKQVIHPQQIPIVHQAYSPSENQISCATKLIQAFNDQQKDGKGAIVFEGSMIDMPLVLQAKNILRMAEIINND